MKKANLKKASILALILPLATSASLMGCKSGSKTTATTPVVEEPYKPINPLVPMSFGPTYKYAELMTKDYEEMLSMVQSMIKKAHEATSKEDSGNDSEAVAQLGRALKLVYSRPNSDNMVTKLVAELRRELQSFNAFEDSVAALTIEALNNYSNPDAGVGTQSTCLVELENILADIRPEAQRGNKVFKRVIARIRDANIQISGAVKKDRRMRGMFQTKNPSEEAQKILAAMEPKKQP